MLAALTPQTLAYLIRDLEEAEADWAYYPESAPPAAVRDAVSQTVALVKLTASAQAAAAGLDFDQLIEQATAEQQQDDWRWQRSQQIRQNWTDDLE